MNMNLRKLHSKMSSLSVQLNEVHNSIEKSEMAMFSMICKWQVKANETYPSFKLVNNPKCAYYENGWVNRDTDELVIDYDTEVDWESGRTDSFVIPMSAVDKDIEGVKEWFDGKLAEYAAKNNARIEAAKKRNTDKEKRRRALYEQLKKEFDSEDEK